MNVFGNYNKISDELKAEIKTLKKGQQQVVRLLNGRFDPVTKRYFYGSLQNIVLQDDIKDPHSGLIVTIGIPDRVENGHVTRPRKFRISPGDEGVNNGLFTLVGGNVEHEQVYWFFQLWNKNKSNPNRDEHETPMVEFVDVKKESKLKRATLDDLTAALVKAKAMDKKAREEFCAVMNWNLQEDEEVLQTRIQEYAKDNPVDFLAKLADESNSTKVTIKQALDKGLISYDPGEHKILDGGTGRTVAVLDRGEAGENEIDCFFSWLESKPNGAQILKNLQSQLKKKLAIEAGE